jgi:hypothetical protein
MEVVVQVSTVVAVLLVMAAVGAVIFWVIITELVEKHPLPPVTVTVYVPAADAVKAGTALTTVLPLLQE